MLIKPFLTAAFVNRALDYVQYALTKQLNMYENNVASS